MIVPNHEAKASFGACHEAAMSSSALRTRRLAQRVSGLCFLILVLEGYNVSAMGYATPSLIEAWHASAPQFTTTVTVGAFGMLLGSLFAGILGDRIGRKPSLIGCVAIFGVFTLLTARSTNLGSLTELRFLASLGLGGGVPLTIALATDYAIVQRPRRLVILMSSGLAIGSTAGGFIARQFVTSFGWESIFIFGGLLPILLASVLIVFLPESRALNTEQGLVRRANPLELFRHGLAAAPHRRPSSASCPSTLPDAGSLRLVSSSSMGTNRLFEKPHPVPYNIDDPVIGPRPCTGA
jgi:MFS family permease